MRALALALVLALPLPAAAALECKQYDTSGWSSQKISLAPAALWSLATDAQTPTPFVEFRRASSEACAQDPTFDLDVVWAESELDDWIAAHLAAVAADSAAEQARIEARRQQATNALANWDTLSAAQKDAVLKEILRYLIEGGL